MSKNNIHNLTNRHIVEIILQDEKKIKYTLFTAVDDKLESFVTYFYEYSAYY